MLLGIKWYHFVSSDEIQCRTNQSALTEIIQARRWLWKLLATGGATLHIHNKVHAEEDDDDGII